MKKIPLTQGQEAIVDDADYEKIKSHRWFAHKSKPGESFYAHTNLRISPGRKGAKVIKMHRMIMDAPRGMEVDHINGDGLDNRKVNLRICNKAQNCQNQRRGRANKSGYKGVSWRKDNGRWRASIGFNENGKRKWKSLGSFETKEQAARAYDAAAKKYHGEFARLNFI